MAKTETKNIVVGNFAGGIGTQSIQMNVLEDVQKNFHNIWMSVCEEPEDADANANGQWVLYLENDSTRAIFAPSVANLNLENRNYSIIACGCWMASNQAPYNMGVPLGRTSRNVRQNGRLILVSYVEGVSAGLVRTKLMLCAGSTTI